MVLLGCVREGTLSWPKRGGKRRCVLFHCGSKRMRYETERENICADDQLGACMFVSTGILRLRSLIAICPDERWLPSHSAANSGRRAAEGMASG